MRGRGEPKPAVHRMRPDSINRNLPLTSIVDREPDIYLTYGGNSAVDIPGDGVNGIVEHRSEEQNINNTQPSTQKGKKKKRREVHFDEPKALEVAKEWVGQPKLTPNQKGIDLWEGLWKKVNERTGKERTVDCNR